MLELVASSSPAGAMHERRKHTFAELDTGGKRIQCPHCHIAFIPHLGDWIAEKFQCKSCKTYLTFRNSPTTTTCPCCNITRPVPNDLKMIVCGGCNAEVVYQIRDRAVKCYLCKDITIPPVGNIGSRPVFRVPGMDQYIYPQIYRLRRNLAATAETESTASSSITPRPETIVVHYSDDSVSETVRTNKREIEEDKTEGTESKKIRL